MYLIKLASVVPLSHKCPSLSTFPNTSFKLDVLSIIETAETLLNFTQLNFVAYFFSKKNTHTNRVLSNEVLLTLTKFYKINLLYRVLLFSFSIKIIHHTFPTYVFLVFSLCACFYVINYIGWIFPKTISGWNKTFSIFCYKHMQPIFVSFCATMTDFIHC